MKIGYIGLGDMGGPIAGHILKAGFELVGLDLIPARLQAIVDQGGEAGSSPADVGGRCEVVILCLDTLKAIETVLFGEGGIVTGAKKPDLVIDSSTMAPEKTKEIAARLAEHGIRMMDAPFSGGASGAQRGDLATMVGGEEADCEKYRKVLESFSNRVTYMGPIGSGMATKACNQIVDYVTVACLGEMVAYGRAFGLRVEALPEAMTGGLADSALLQEYAREKATTPGPTVMLVDGMADLFLGRIKPEARGRYGISVKDVQIAMDSARASGSTTPFTALAESCLRLIHIQPEQK